MKFPFVSRHLLEMAERIIAIHEQTISQLRKERDEQQSRADRAVDTFLLHAGAPPVSSPMREEERKVIEEQQAAALTLQQLFSQVDKDIALDTQMDFSEVAN